MIDPTNRQGKNDDIGQRRGLSWSDAFEWVKGCLITNVNQSISSKPQRFTLIPHSSFFPLLSPHCQIFVRVMCSYEPLWRGTSILRLMFTSMQTHLILETSQYAL